MLYWAEGAKDRNMASFANSDAAMVELYSRFLRESLEVDPKRIRLRVNCYTGNGKEVDEIEDYWLGIVGLGRNNLYAPTVDLHPASQSGKQKGKLLYGVCDLRVTSTEIVQHIFGAIQEYGGFEEPAWLG